MLIKSAQVRVHWSDWCVHQAVQIIFLVDKLLRILAEYPVNNFLIKNRHSWYLLFLFPFIMRRGGSVILIIVEPLIVLPSDECLLSVHVECAQELAFMNVSFVIGVTLPRSYWSLLFKYFILVVLLFTGGTHTFFCNLAVFLRVLGGWVVGNQVFLLEIQQKLLFRVQLKRNKKFKLPQLGHDVHTVELLDDLLFSFLVKLHFLFLGSHSIVLILFVGT